MKISNTGMNSRNMKKPRPRLPTSDSPHAFLSNDTERPTASIGPVFSTTSTGTTKNVMIDQAVPRIIDT